MSHPSTPSKVKLLAKVEAHNVATGAVVLLKTKTDSVWMSPPAAYAMAERYRANPITSDGYEYHVVLVKAEVTPSTPEDANAVQS